MLPSSYGFLEMYDVGKIEQLNILERWKKNDSTISLQAPIGIDSAGMPIVLDIHEKIPWTTWTNCRFNRFWKK